jgi:hypothetical protein
VTSSGSASREYALDGTGSVKRSGKPMGLDCLGAFRLRSLNFRLRPPSFGGTSWRTSHASQCRTCNLSFDSQAACYPGVITRLVAIFTSGHHWIPPTSSLVGAVVQPRSTFRGSERGFLRTHRAPIVLGRVMTILPMVALGTPSFAESLASLTVRSIDPGSSTSRSSETEWTPILDCCPKYRFRAEKKMKAQTELHSPAT